MRVKVVVYVTAVFCYTANCTQLLPPGSSWTLVWQITVNLSKIFGCFMQTRLKLCLYANKISWKRWHSNTRIFGDIVVCDHLIFGSLTQ